MKTVQINKEMAYRTRLTEEICKGMEMTKAQKEVFLIVDEWWKSRGYGPSIRDICQLRGKGGLGNTSEIIDRLVRLGVLKKLKGAGRSVRPVYLNFRTLE